MRDLYDAFMEIDPVDSMLVGYLLVASVMLGSGLWKFILWPLLKLLWHAPGWLISWFGQHFDRRKPWGDPEIGLQRMRAPNVPWAGGTMLCYVYWCPCGEQLEEGPCGGCAVNAVCNTCRVNYGNLPGFTFGSGEWRHSRRTAKPCS